MAFGKVSNEVHFFPAVLLFGCDSGKAELLQRFAFHEVDDAI